MVTRDNIGPMQLVAHVSTIDGDQAIVVDQFGQHRTIPVSIRPGRNVALPAVGEQWIISRHLGFWSFAMLVPQNDLVAPRVVTGDREGNTALADLLAELVSLGLVVDQTTSAPAPAPPIITGSRMGNAALGDLLADLDVLGIVDDQTTPGDPAFVPPPSPPVITGDRGGVAALGDLIADLANLGLVVDQTTPGAAQFVPPSNPPAVTGERQGNAALGDLLADLASLGIVVDQTTAGSAPKFILPPHGPISESVTVSESRPWLSPEPFSLLGATVTLRTAGTTSTVVEVRKNGAVLGVLTLTSGVVGPITLTLATPVAFATTDYLSFAVTSAGTGALGLVAQPRAIAA